MRGAALILARNLVLAPGCLATAFRLAARAPQALESLIGHYCTHPASPFMQERLFSAEQAHDL